MKERNRKSDAAVMGCEVRRRKEPGKERSRRREQEVQKPRAGSGSYFAPGIAGSVRLECSQWGRMAWGHQRKAGRSHVCRTRSHYKEFQAEFSV